MTSERITDRFQKYAYGVLRLSLIFAILTYTIFPSSSSTSSLLATSSYLPYLPRWIGCVYLGAIGAPINTNLYNLPLHLLLLLLGGLYCLYDLFVYQDDILLIYLFKTFTGDYLTGKLDTIEWKVVLLFLYGFLLPLFLFYDPSFSHNALSYLKIFLLLFLIQFICEYGDNYYEHYLFFRHRYSYELFNLLTVLLVPLAPYELTIIQFDILICLFYRISNALLILSQTEIVSTSLKMLGFKFHGYLIGIPVINVTDPEIAMLVMKNSVDKGLALERYIATPAWEPILSIESVDGEVWREMSKNFHSLLPTLPSVSHLQTVTKHHTDQLIQSKAQAHSNHVIDAEDIAHLSITIFLDFLFGIRLLLAPSPPSESSESRSPESVVEINQRIHELYDLFVQASWEWRKEISVRGKADRDVKSRTVEAFLNILEEPEKYVARSEDVVRVKKIASLFGEKWKQPEYFSLILQPFLISPCINTGDIMVAIKAHPELPLEAAIRAMHPFPIFERYVPHDITLPSSSHRPPCSSEKKGQQQGAAPVVVVKGNTQVIMFTSDFLISNPNSSWNIFGAGDRICSGMHLALPYLRILHHSFHPLLLPTAPSRGEAKEKSGEGDGEETETVCAVSFEPELHHRYSGRNNDGKSSLVEFLYLLSLVAGIFSSKIIAQHFGNRKAK